MAVMEFEFVETDQQKGPEVRNGRYLIDGVSHVRVTNIVKLATQSHSLNKWRERTMISGIVAGGNQLLERAHLAVASGAYGELESVASDATRLGGGYDGANWGKALHAVIASGDQAHLESLPTGMAQDVESVWSEIDAVGLTLVPESSETVIRVDPEFSLGVPIAGTTDGLYRTESGELVVCDIKTSKASSIVYTRQSAALQMALYASGSEWWPNGIREPFPEVSRECAFLISIPRQTAHCEIFRISLKPAIEQIKALIAFHKARQENPLTARDCVLVRGTASV